MRAFPTVWATELRLATRNADQVLFGIVLPVATVLLLGLVSSPEAMRLNLAGVMTFGLCAAGLMGFPLTLADYRHRKVLKRFRVTPVSPAVLLAAQALTSLVLVVVSGAAVYAIGSVGFGVRATGGPGGFVAAYGLVTAAVFGLGALVAATAPSFRAASAIASLLYFPTIFLSGVTVPFELLPAPLQAAVQVLPVTHGVALLKAVIVGASWDQVAVPVGVLAAVAAVSYAVAIVRFRWE